MKQFCLFMIIILGSSSVTMSQVGVNTTNPLGLFYVDGRGNNDTNPTAAQILDDVIVTANGLVGVGISNPTVKLDIRTTGTAATPIAGITISDGTQATGRFLMSDANGVGSWQSGATTALEWDNNRIFTIPRRGLYLVTIYLDDDLDSRVYTNVWSTPVLDAGNSSNRVQLYSRTNSEVVLANNNSFPSYGVSCSATLVLEANEQLEVRGLAWVSARAPLLGVEIIPL